MMFDIETLAGGPITKDYAERRQQWEPLYEATQINGDGKAHPLLSPDDEFADYETWDASNLDVTELKQPGMLKYEYAREALKTGLSLEQSLGIEPEPHRWEHVVIKSPVHDECQQSLIWSDDTHSASRRVSR